MLGQIPGGANKGSQSSHRNTLQCCQIIEHLQVIACCCLEGGRLEPVFDLQVEDEGCHVVDLLLKPLVDGADLMLQQG